LFYSLLLQVVPLTDEFKSWADLAALSYGGSDMLAMDAVVDPDGNKFIIEINGARGCVGE
jgi:hypothetical protein